MAQAHQGARPHFSQPIRQIVTMLVAIALAGGGVFMALPYVLPVFYANPYLNGFILLVFGIGVLACFYQVTQLIGSVRWIEAFVGGVVREDARTPQLLAPLASLLRERGARSQISSSSTRSILDSVAERVEEEREITRYITNVLIYLGLLGTFFGLATTVPAIVDTIRSLNPQEGEEGLAVFNRLMVGLEAQLQGMGVAFGSSLLGLAGSLIVGLLELFAGHGQSRFYRELEEWLSSITRVGFASGDEGGAELAVLTPVLDAMSEQMNALQDLFEAQEADRASVSANLNQLVSSIGEMNMRQSEAEGVTAALERVALGQDALLDHMREQGTGDGIDAESRMRLRSMDVQLLRILEEISAGRQESMNELRKDIELLVKALTLPRGAVRTTPDGE
ncbi:MULTISPECIES: biopolymer transporter ExbB [unclassified Ruegeria]|uniref:biopolymer transporter ExbB n=1 Tax=unclassified Ruegeria TaxID=2625375 RepID=UPI001ADB5C4C|nr:MULTISPECIES: biopolymer transporter ExbB [unclassified Ruegeria]MBO9411042.1 biopolymer transporter ExbB [Ruegeria sp. R8_1]MBO9415243.1 biopolymer transporter ExbB [Ruegeria sp. R8_2]